jgi:hypothetical protein
MNHGIMTNESGFSSRYNITNVYPVEKAGEKTACNVKFES